jgi:prophage DNA circulation protein
MSLLFPSWYEQLQPASWRGLPFGVLDSEIQRGRMVAVHEYPYRDGVWVEDLGRAGRRIGVRGWLIGDDVIARRKAFAAACEVAGSGTLVHPQLGPMQLVLARPASIKDQWDEGLMARLDLEFIETATILYPVRPVSLFRQIISAVASVIAAVRKVIATVMGAIFAVAGAVASVIATVHQFVGLVTSLVTDPLAVFNSVLGLVGSFGRFATGARSTLQAPDATVSSLLAAATTARTTIGDDATTAIAAAGSAIGAPDPLATAIFALVADAAAFATNPADQVRLLANLAAYQPAGPAGSGAPGAAQAAARNAVGDLCRQAALAQLATAAANYQPTSRQDALGLQTQVVALLDAEITLAGDAGNDDLYLSLLGLRTALVQRLYAAAGTLPDLVTISTNAPMPSLALAYRQYLDATRADEMVLRANPPHPAFMPTSFEALAT